MSIDRFILKKLDTCPGTQTQTHLLQLFKIRIHKAQMTEESYFNMR
jgi:hypothetical protein